MARAFLLLEGELISIIEVKVIFAVVKQLLKAVVAKKAQKALKALSLLFFISQFIYMIYIIERNSLSLLLQLMLFKFPFLNTITYSYFCN